MGAFPWWLLPDSNWGHKALQASALPTELKSQSARYRLYNTLLRRFFQWQGAVLCSAGSLLHFWYSILRQFCSLYNKMRLFCIYFELSVSYSL